MRAHDQFPLMEVLQSPTTDHFPRLVYYHKQFMSLWKSVSQPFVVFIESPILAGGRVNSTVVQAQAAAMCVVSALLCGADGVYEVHPGTWKKEVVGHGNASKKDVAAWLSEHRPEYSSLADGDQDIVDASCIALYGQGVVSRSSSIVDPSVDIRGSAALDE